MYSMSPSFSNVPYSGAKGMLRTIFGLDHLGEDALEIKNTLLQVTGTCEDLQDEGLSIPFNRFGTHFL